ncbi:hypothetical protein C2E23DRAFT_882180 [Lenzites betulinus]|nr:hypothetical protein C2E23DRAFT_882180 [Lenzites betulinus]
MSSCDGRAPTLSRSASHTPDLSDEIPSVDLWTVPDTADTPMTSLVEGTNMRRDVADGATYSFFSSLVYAGPTTLKESQKPTKSPSPVEAPVERPPSIASTQAPDVCTAKIIPEQPPGESSTHVERVPSYRSATEVDRNMSTAPAAASNPRDQVIVLPWPMGERLLALLATYEEREGGSISELHVKCKANPKLNQLLHLLLYSIIVIRVDSTIIVVDSIVFGVDPIVVCVDSTIIRVDPTVVWSTTIWGYTARRRARSAGRSSETRSPSITRFYGYPSPIASSVHKGESGFLASSAPSPTSPVQEAAFVPSPPGLPNRTPADTAAAQPSGEAGAHTGPAPSYPASAATAADGSPPIVIASGAETSADPRSQVIVLPWPMGERLLALLSSTSLPGTAARPGGELGAPAHGESEYLPAYEEREGPPAAVGGPFSRGPVRASPRLETRGTNVRAPMSGMFCDVPTVSKFSIKLGDGV